MDRFGYMDALHAVYASSADCSLRWFRCSMAALLPQLKLGSELVVTVVDERLPPPVAEHRMHSRRMQE